jgi:hypothetical protein
MKESGAVMLTEFAYVIKGGLVAWPKGDCQFLIGHIVVESKQGTRVKAFVVQKHVRRDVSGDNSWILF